MLLLGIYVELSARKHHCQNLTFLLDGNQMAVVVVVVVIRYSGSSGRFNFDSTGFSFPLSLTVAQWKCWHLFGKNKFQLYGALNKHRLLLLLLMLLINKVFFFLEFEGKKTISTTAAVHLGDSLNSYNNTNGWFFGIAAIVQFFEEASSGNRSESYFFWLVR